jgi:transmembrane sensor
MKEENISDSLREAITGYLTNSLTQIQAEELRIWLEETEENRHYLQELGKLWYASSQLSTKEKEAESAWADLQHKINENDIRRIKKPELKIGVSVLLRVAATILILAGIGLGTLYIFRSPEMKSEVSYFEAFAPKGSRSFITLSDGSTVWLNSGTRLKYQSNFGKEGRDLFLDGEAYFVVAKNPDMPFRVKTSDVCITAIGTAFNVKAYNEEGSIETTLEKGEVRIDALDNSKIKAETASVYLKPNQKAVYLKSSKNINVNNSSQQTHNVPIEPVSKIKTLPLRVENMADTKLTTSWKDSRWIFKSEKLFNLTPILERRYDIRIIFRDSILRTYKFTGTLKEESLEQVLKAMSLAAPIKYEINHNQVLFFLDSDMKNYYKKPLKSN